MVRIRLSEDEERRLERVAKRAGKNKTALAEEAVILKMDELEAEYPPEAQPPKLGRWS